MIIYTDFFYNISKQWIRGITLFPFIFIAKKYQFDVILHKHEKIHIQQQLKYLIIPFYLIYGIDFLIQYLKYKDFNVAYRNIGFEKEAFAKEKL